MDEIIKKPVMIVIAGPNGSGKTSITESLLRQHWLKDCEYINPDNIARDVYGDWNSAESSLKAAVMSDNLRDQYIAEHKDFAFETVMSSQGKIDVIKKAKDAGYFIRLFFVGTDSPKINAYRIASRVMEGGHDVPISKIISRYTKSISNCIDVLKIVDRGYVYDNSEDGKEARLLFKSVDGKIAKSYSKINDWAALISNQLPKSDVEFKLTLDALNKLGNSHRGKTP